MKSLTFLAASALIAAAAAPAACAVKYVAVVETELDARSGASEDLGAAEVALITAELRREAVKNLPPDKYNIMTSETVQAQGGAVLEKCIDENCVVTLGATIGADYIVRGIISKFKTRLTLTVEMYETEDGTLVASSDPVRSENAAELLEKTSAACAEMYKTFVNTRPAAQKAPPPPAAYTVTAAPAPAGGGTVSRNPDQTVYAPGTRVNLMAVPASGYRFTGWSGDASGAENPLTLTMDDSKMLTANFQYARPEYKLATNVNPADGGRVSRSPAHPHKETYTPGERVTLTATPENGYTFIGWTGASSSRKNRLTLTMDADKALTANFYRKANPTPQAQTPQPSAGVVARDPLAKKRYTQLAVGLDALGAGVLLFGYTRDMNVKDLVDDWQFGDAEAQAGWRNAAYAAGALILLSGVSVHIFF